MTLLEEEAVLNEDFTGDSDEEREVASGPPMSGDQCNYFDEHGERCQLFLPEGHHKTRKFCDGHQKGGYLLKGKKVSGPKDKPPVNINVKLPGTTGPKTKLEGQKAQVASAATAWLGLIAAGVEMSGDETCSGAIKAATPAVALSLAELSGYHPIIVKVLCPVEASGEIAVWIGLALALSPVIIAVLAHHELIPPSWAEKIAVAASMGAVVASAAPEAA